MQADKIPLPSPDEYIHEDMIQSLKKLRKYRIYNTEQNGHRRTKLLNQNVIEEVNYRKV
jgi:hypothetical protein